MPAPLPPPRDLTVPEPGSRTARDVLSRALGRLMREVRPALRAHGARAQALDVMDPGELASRLRDVRVAVLLRTLRSTPPGQGGVLAAKLVEALASGPPPPPRPHPVVEDGIVLGLTDDNPLAGVEAHPDKHGNTVDLGGRPAAEWVDALRGALAVVARTMPALREEMTLYVQQIVPVGFLPEKHWSASYREAIGTLYLSLHPNAMTMVEALVHEFQHNKLNALLELDDVLENAHTPLYKSPVRPDPRPLHGVLLAVHAFVPVAVLYERMIEAGDPRAREERLREIVRINREGTAVLRENARPTAVGRGLLEELFRWDEHFARMP